MNMKQNMNYKDRKKKILLVHGFGMDLLFSILEALKMYDKLEKRKFDIGFPAFTELIKEGWAKLFVWYADIKDVLEEKENIFDIKSALKIYNYEKEKSISTEVLKRLNDMIMDFQPEVLVGHSMGAFMIFNYLKKFNLSDSVRNIYFVQGDFPNDWQIEDENIKSRIDSDRLRIINIYCNWDPILYVSKFVNKTYTPAGISRCSDPYILNLFFPLKKNINLHNSTLSDKDFVELVLKY